MGITLTSSTSRTALLVTLVASLSAAFAADQEPGLLGEYFAFDHAVGDFQELKDLKPTFVRIDKQVNFPDQEGPFYGTKLVENFEARWTGSVKIDKDGSYTFATESDDGSRLFIDDKQVVDNGGPHGMGKKSGQVQLSAGLHQVRLDFFQGNGGAGCKLWWTPPGGSESVIGGSALSHDKGAETKVSWDQLAWKKRKGPTGAPASGWFYDMDYGPQLSDTIASPSPANNLAIKGHAVKLTAKVGDQVVVGGLCFDADLLRWSAGWTGGFLELKGVAYDGAHGVPGPKTAGMQIFGTPQLPGWSKSESFDDPRSEPYGPLPADLAKYKGHYINGDRVVFSYTVGAGTVLELPGFEADGKAVSRTLSIANVGPVTNLVAELPDGTGSVAGGVATLSAGDNKVSVGLVDAPAGVSLAVVGNRILLKIGATAAATFKVVIVNADAAAAAPIIAAASAITDPKTLTKGGAPRYPETVETKGELGTPVDATSPYVVDTITVPESNPWKSKLRFAGFDFFSDGRAAVSTWNGDVWVVSGIDASLGKLTWKRFATGLHQPLGLKIVDDVVYVTTRDGIERLVDLNKDGEADFYEAFNNDVHTSGGFHEFSFDLWTDPEGNFYYAKAGPVKPGGRGFEHITESNGCMFKISKDGSKSEVFATGFRAPNGMSVGPKGEVTSGDNEGTWTPSSRVNLIVKGGFYGVPPLAHRTPEPTDYDKPILWIPHNTGPIDNSCGGQAWVLGNKWGLPEGSLLHMSYGTSSLFLVSWGMDGSIAQGGCVRFPLTFNTGIMRARFNATDGQLYVCGLRGWQTNGAKEAGFQRVRYTGKTVHMPVGYVVKKNGISLTFSTPLDRASAGAKDNYSAEEWNYIWAENYGSPEVHVDDPKKNGHDPVEISSVTLSADGKTVFLEMPKIRTVMQMKIKYKIAGADGEPVQADYYNTINVVGSQEGP